MYFKFSYMYNWFDSISSTIKDLRMELYEKIVKGCKASPFFLLPFQYVIYFEREKVPDD